MSNLMKVQEAKGVCKDRSKWKEVISAYPNGKRACYVCMYVRIYLRISNKYESVTRNKFLMKSFITLK
jgi:hypothetical protein